MFDVNATSKKSPYVHHIHPYIFFVLLKYNTTLTVSLSLVGLSWL